MKKILPLALLCASSIGAFALPSFEPFADATGTGGTSYANAAPLAGQINAYGEKWYGIATGQPGASVVLTNVSLAVSNGMPASSGSAVVLVNQLGPGARFNVGTNSTASPMTLFYSAFIQVNDATSLIVANQGGNAGGGFNMGFNNTTGTDTAQTTQPTAYAAPLYMADIIAVTVSVSAVRLARQGIVSGNRAGRTRLVISCLLWSNTKRSLAPPMT